MNKSDSWDEGGASSPGALEQREALLNRLALEIHRSSDVYEVTRVATEGLARLLEADRVLFFLVQPGDILQPIHERVRPGVPSAWRQYPLSSYRELVQALGERGVLAIGDVENDPLTRPHYSTLYHPLGTRSLIYAAVLLEGTLKGVVSLGVIRHHRHWKDADIELVRAATHHIGIALRQAELIEHLQRSEQRYRDMFEKAVVGLYQSTPEGRILTANPALVKMLGYDSLEELLEVDIERTLYLDPAQRRKNIAELHRTGTIVGAQFALRRKDGTVLAVEEHARAVRDASGRILFYEGTLIDITEKKALERQLLQAQRMESVGMLAAGVAHHFNNVLTIILGYTSSLLADIRPGDPQAEALAQIEKAAHRAAHLTRQLLTFSRQTTTQPRRINLNAIVDKAIQFLRPTFDSNLIIHVNKAEDLWPIEADPAQIEQALVNLCINSREAMPQGGTLILETENRRLKSTPSQTPSGTLRSGEYVAVTIRDTGRGMSEEDLRRIFDPFFTTKEVGQGTGLGLAIVYGIVKNHDGLIDVESQPGIGTRITLLFPAASRPAGEPDASLGSSAPFSAQRAILVVDDEPTVLRFTETILRQRGFHTVTASDGAEALELYQQRKDDIDLLILNVNMPTMSGITCYRWLARINPSVKVILTSGYSSDDIEGDILAAPAVRFVQKPYLTQDLMRVVTELLASDARLP